MVFSSSESRGCTNQLVFSSSESRGCRNEQVLSSSEIRGCRNLVLSSSESHGYRNQLALSSSESLGCRNQLVLSSLNHLAVEINWFYPVLNPAAVERYDPYFCIRQLNLLNIFWHIQHCEKNVHIVVQYADLVSAYTQARRKQCPRSRWLCGQTQQ